jgi:hypothetical protein
MFRLADTAPPNPSNPIIRGTGAALVLVMYDWMSRFF